MHVLSKHAVLSGDVDYCCLLCELTFTRCEQALTHVTSQPHLDRFTASSYADKYADQRIRKVKQCFYCEACNAIITSSRKIAQHVTEVMHQFYIDDADDEETTPESSFRRLGHRVVAREDVLIEEEAWNGIVDSSCIVCDVDWDDVRSHVADAKHVINLIQLKIVGSSNSGSALLRQIDQTNLQCLTCNTIISQEQSVNHSDSREHQTLYIKSRRAKREADKNIIAHDNAAIKEGTPRNTTHEQRKTTHDQSKSTDEQTKTTDEQTKTTTEQTKTTDEQTKTTAEQTKTTDKQTKTDDQINTNDEQKKANDEQIKTTDEQSNTNVDQKKTTGEHTTDEQICTSDKHTKATHVHANTTNVQSKTTGEQQKTTVKQLKATGEQTKSTDEQTKTTDEPTKITNEPKKTIDEPKKTTHEAMKTTDEQKEQNLYRQSEQKQNKVLKQDEDVQKDPGKTSINCSSTTELNDNIIKYVFRDFNHEVPSISQKNKKNNLISIDLVFDLLRKAKVKSESVTTSDPVTSDLKELETSEKPTGGAASSVDNKDNAQPVLSNYLYKYNESESGEKVVCLLCNVGLPSQQNFLTDHLNGVKHENNVAKYRKYEKTKGVDVDTGIRNKGSAKDKLYSCETMENFTEIWNHSGPDDCINEYCVINNTMCIDVMSFCLSVIFYDKVVCVCCKEVLEYCHFEQHFNSTAHKRKFAAVRVVVSLKGEFVREVTNDKFHCGFCNTIVVSWRKLEKHLASPQHLQQRRLDGEQLQYCIRNRLMGCGMGEQKQQFIKQLKQIEQLSYFK